MNISPVDLVLRVAAATVGASEVPANTNGGPYVERVLAVVGLKKGQPWCAAHVADIGQKALGTKWPLPLTGGCQALYEFAIAKRIVHNGPERGDVFLIWHPELGRFAHTGFVRSRDLEGYSTHEGNTSGAGSREGWLVAERTRRHNAADRFISWSSLVPDV